MLSCLNKMQDYEICVFSMGADVWIGGGRSPCTGRETAGFEGTDSLYRKVEGFGVGLPQESVSPFGQHLLFPFGDTLWYKGYVMRSDRGTLTDLSKIPLRGASHAGRVFRGTAAIGDGGRHSPRHVRAQDTLYAGYYELRAYTRWMLNFGQCEYPHVRISEDLF